MSAAFQTNRASWQSRGGAERRLAGRGEPTRELALSLHLGTVDSYRDGRAVRGGLAVDDDPVLAVVLCGVECPVGLADEFVGGDGLV